MVPTDKPPVPPAMVLYLTCGEENTPGKVYQVDDKGRVLGIVNLPYTATGIALHRNHGLMLAVPRDGGKIMKIDDTGKLSTVLDKTKELTHPVDVACPPDSDAVLVADNMAMCLAATSSEGGEPRMYHRFPEQKWHTPDMAVAVAKDKQVLFSTNNPEGVYRFSGDQTSMKSAPLLPSQGGVAADISSCKWAAAQPPNKVYVFEGEELVKKFTLPPNKSVYNHGLLSFAPAGNVVVATVPSDDPAGQVWFLEYGVEQEQVNSLFPWDKEKIQDFVVGPRMIWDRNNRNPYKSIY